MATALAGLQVLRSAEGEALVARLRSLVDQLRPGHPSPIVPVVLGDEDRAVGVAEALLERGLLVPAIRPPTVAPAPADCASRSPRRTSPTTWTTSARRSTSWESTSMAGAPGRTRWSWWPGRAPRWARPGVAAELPSRWPGGGAACKQSFEPGDVDAGVTDADLLAAATGEDPAVVCPPHRRYEVPMAPPMAAEVLGPAARSASPGSAAEVAVSWPPEAPDMGLVELAGGVRSPPLTTATASIWPPTVRPDVALLVADAGLGTINGVRLSADALVAGLGDAVDVVVHLNRFDETDDLHRRNLAWLRTREGLDVVTDAEALADVLVQRMG